MVEWTVFWIGVVVLGVVAVMCMEDDDDLKGIIILMGIVFVVIGFLLTDDKGKAMENISEGKYSIVSMAKINRGDQPYLNMLLKKDGEVRFYSFPEDMVIREKSESSSASVEVVKKGDLKKIALR